MLGTFSQSFVDNQSVKTHCPWSILSRQIHRYPYHVVALHPSGCLPYFDTSMSTSIRCTNMNLRKLHDISSFPCKSGTEVPCNLSIKVIHPLKIQLFQKTCHSPSNTGTFPATELALFETVCAGSALAVFIRRHESCALVNDWGPLLVGHMHVRLK